MHFGSLWRGKNRLQAERNKPQTTNRQIVTMTKLFNDIYYDGIAFQSISICVEQLLQLRFQIIIAIHVPMNDQSMVLIEYPAS